MKKLFAFVSLILCLGMLTACLGTPVIYHDSDCDCSESGTKSEVEKPIPEGALKTGIALVTDISGSVAGEAKYDVTMVAVLVDDNGVIMDCVIDSINTSVKFDAAGKLTTDRSAAIQTKNELGDSYMMPSGSWKSQAKALADFAIGKNVAQFKDGAVNESGKAPEGSDLASSASIYLGGYVSAIEKAVANAKHLGAMGGDTLKMGTLVSIDKDSKDAAADKDGLAQLDVDLTAITMKDGKITSCAIDAVQAKVNFDTAGAIKTDLSAAVKTKNELGADYNMVNWGNAKAEWNEQAASFAEYVTGKTIAEVEGIAVDAGTKPTDADLSASVTIAIGGFKALLAKAAQ